MTSHEQAGGDLIKYIEAASDYYRAFHDSKGLNRDQQITARVIKTQNECGELAEAHFNMHGLNPRKPQTTNGYMEVMNEALDTAITALMVVERLNPGALRDALPRYIAKKAERIPDLYKGELT